MKVHFGFFFDKNYKQDQSLLMEEKKLDINSIIGFILIFGILLWMLYNNQPTPEELQAQEKAKQEQIESENKVSSDSDIDISEVASD